MAEWLVESVSLNSAIPAAQMLTRLLVSLLYGGMVSVIYRFSHGRQKEDAATLATTLVLLSILIAMVSMVIGDSVARAFSLVGALSIVRFRTVVDDTRDTAFVIFAVIVGMAAGAGLLLVPLMGIPIVGCVAIALSREGRIAPTLLDVPESTLMVRLGLGRDPNLSLGGVLNKYAESCRLRSIETARQGAALDLKYLVRLRMPDEMASMVAELNQLEGVQNVEMRS